MHYKIIVFHRNICSLFRRKPKTTFFALYTPLCVCVSAVRLGFPFSFRFCSEVNSLFVRLFDLSCIINSERTFFLPTLAHKARAPTYTPIVYVVLDQTH